MPDVYEGAPTIVVLLFASLPKLAVFIFLVKFYISFLHEIAGLWYTIFFFAGLISILWGTFGALNQLNIKRLYAYSAIVNVGYLLTALAYGSFESIVVVINFLVVSFHQGKMNGKAFTKRIEVIADGIKEVYDKISC